MLLIVALAPAWNGVVGAIKARMQIRRGLPCCSATATSRSSASKETVLSEDASPSRVAPLRARRRAHRVHVDAGAHDAAWLGFAGDLVIRSRCSR